MGMTQSQKILAAHAGKSSVKAGELIEASLDMVLGNDITAPVAVDVYAKEGLDSVYNADRIALVLDHSTPCKDLQTAKLCMKVREFAKRFGIANLYDTGCVGIEHALLPEKGLVGPGDCIIGADSHTCTYGALGAFSTGVGSTDMAAGMFSGKAWFKVPAAIRVELKGHFRKHVQGKDLILHLIGILGVSGALYKSLEFTGDGVSALTMDDRFTVANMAIECGAKNGIFPVDDATREYARIHFPRPVVEYTADPDAEYERVIKIDLDELPPTVAMPFLPSNAKPVSEVAGLPIQQVVIGSCTNGRMSDLRQAAAVLRGKSVAPGIRCIVIPATPAIQRQAMSEGLLEVFLTAGCAVSTPTCGPCLGGHMGILGPGERAVATTNRNFLGRMGDVTSEVILASPAVAAASAIAGKLVAPEE